MLRSGSRQFEVIIPELFLKSSDIIFSSWVRNTGFIFAVFSTRRNPYWLKIGICDKLLFVLSRTVRLFRFRTNSVMVSTCKNLSHHSRDLPGVVVFTWHIQCAKDKFVFQAGFLAQYFGADLLK